MFIEIDNMEEIMGRLGWDAGWSLPTRDLAAMIAAQEQWDMLISLIASTD